MRNEWLDTGTWSSGDKSGPRCKYESGASV